MQRRRNVLLIVVDQWRADFVPALGAGFLRTPNLDRLCREGVTFANHVTTTVPCGPARASLLTGLRATYAGLMSEIDDNLGRVFAHLDETKQWEDTMVVFTSDHGEQLGDHWLLGKIGYFDESFRIPLVVKEAGCPARAGQVEHGFTESIDLMPTILETLSGEIPRAVDGVSLAPLLAGVAPAGWRDALHYEYDFRDLFYSRPESALGLDMDECSLCVIQDARFKYVHFAALPPLFFDLERDPHQFTNLAESPAHAGLVKEYAQRALSWRLCHAERTLTAYRATPQGLEDRGT